MAKREIIHAANQHSNAWTEKEEALLGTMTDVEVAEKIGRTKTAVTQHRLKMEVAAFSPRSYSWRENDLALLGMMSDIKLAEKLGVSRKFIIGERKKRGIRAFHHELSPVRRRRRK